MRSLFSPAFRQNVHQCDPRKFFVALLLENLKNCQKHPSDAISPEIANFKDAVRKTSMLPEFTALALDSRPQHADVLGGGGYSFLPLSDELRQRSEKTLLKTKSFGSASVGEVYSFDGVKNNCKEERKLLCHLRTSAIVAFLKHFHVSAFPSLLQGWP